MNVYPSQADFCRQAQEYNIVPVYTELLTDMDTPVSTYYKLVGEGDGFILESAETSKTFGRYSFIGAQPFAKISAYRQHSEITLDNKTFTVEKAPLEAVRELLKAFSCPALPNLPPFTGGAVGYFSYDAVGTWERIRGCSIADDTRLAELLLCRIIIIMDHLTHSTTMIRLVNVTPGNDLSALYEQAAQDLKDLIEKLQQPVVLPHEEMTIFKPSKKPMIQQALDEKLAEKFIAAVDKAKEYIAAGDIFQVVLSQQFCSKLKKHPFTLYRRLRQVNPSPYMFYISYGERKLVGASPEMLVKLDGTEVTTYPIAGTRPRGKDLAEDARLAAELLADTKEIAEHAMLVDLGRNDIGRISLPGTVKVKRMMQVEKFSHVMHMVSEVIGQIDPHYSALDAFAACFPAGTVSGAPKVRAMEIINELEDVQRGPYAGAVGYWDFRGNMDTCITIRTMVVDGDDIVIQTGAGIVADSVPATEYQEILHKAKALFQVVAEDEDENIDN